MSHYILVRKFIPMPEAMKIPDAKAAVEKEWEKLKKIPAWQLTKVRNTNEVIADMLTKGNFTRDEWNNLLCLFNISHFSSLCCAKNFSLISCTDRMAKRMQEQSEENRIVAKSRPTAMKLTSSVATSSSSWNSPIASRCPVILKASSRQVGLSRKPGVNTRQNSNPDAASSSQGWQRDAQLFISTGKPVATDKDQMSLIRQKKICH